MPYLPPRTRLLVLGALLALAITLLLVLALRPRTQNGSGLELPSNLPSVSSQQQGSSGSSLAEPEVLLAVGDIGSCESQADDAVADLASRLTGTIALLGDTVYERGTSQEFAQCFDPAWGPMQSRIRPAVGNHEYLTGGAAGYFDYFGSAAGAAREGWYSYQLGGWHMVVLNSNCSLVGCGAGSPQRQWLRTDLAEHPTDCVLAYWHHPRWSSGRHGSTPAVDGFWQDLRQAGADIVLSGHDHTYERVEVDGVREFVVGTGGRSLYQFQKPALPQTEARSDDAYGLLWLSLGEGSYSWEFLGLGSSGFTDSGTGTC